MENTSIHTGQILKNYINKNKISKAALARKLGLVDSTILRFQKSNSLQNNTLIRICFALKHNFFADIAALLPKEFSTDAPQDTSKDQRIAQLEQEILILKSQLEVLKEVMGKS